MSIKISQNSKIYVLLHTNQATGGSELLHQLVYHLRNDLKIEAYLYCPYNDSNPIHQFYKKYNNPAIKSIEDSNNNVLLFPEAYWILPTISRYQNIKKTMWWLSVDNFYLSIFLGNRKDFFLDKAINKVWRFFFKKTLIDIEEKIYKKIDFSILKLPKEVQNLDLYLAQSFYALNYLLQQGIPKEKVFYLSDYLNEDFLKTKVDLPKKENVVIYNPKKGREFTKKIIKEAKDIKFIPIINMTPKQVIEALQKAKVYIDFGNHPGKDRIPREAAILGCCIITGKRGSAAFYEDVPIPNEYKFDDDEENIPKIINKIKDCFESFDKRHLDFNHYREVIKQEPQKFIENLREIFVKI